MPQPKHQDNISLNDTLHSGPYLLAIVLKILLRFCLVQVVLVVDIRQKSSIFMWYENMENPYLINVYRFTRLAFELTCSPFILNASVKAHVKNSINDETIRILTEFLRDLHVDDTATFFNLASEAPKFYSVCKQALLKGGFQLRKWESNDFNLQKSITEKEIDNSKFSSNPSTDDATYDQYQLGLNNPQFRKVLGMN